MKRLAYALLAIFLATDARAMDTSNFRYITIGSEDAPLTIVEYTSLTCHHCADFHLYVLPVIKQKYINTGRLRWVIMPFPMDKDAIMAFELVNAMPAERREEAVSKLFSAQKQWIGKPAEEAGKTLGLSAAESKKAIGDKDVETALLAGSYHAQKELSVTATPTFYLDSHKVEGALTIEEFEKHFPILKEDGNSKEQQTPVSRMY